MTLTNVLTCVFLGIVLDRFLMFIGSIIVIPMTEARFRVNLKDGTFQDFRIRFMGRAKIEFIEAKMPDGEILKVIE